MHCRCLKEALQKPVVSSQMNAKTFWSRIVTQCYPDEQHKPSFEPAREPLAFWVVSVAQPQDWWNTYEQNIFAVYETFSLLSQL